MEPHNFIQGLENVATVILLPDSFYRYGCTSLSALANVATLVLLLKDIYSE